MRRSLGPAAALALAVAMVAAGCGSGGNRYSLDPTEKCLQKEGLHVVPDTAPLLHGSGGNLRVEFGYGSPKVFVAFGKDEAEAKAIEGKAVAAAKKFAALDEKTIRDGVAQVRNVFYYSDSGPLTGVARDKVGGCLR
jgi:hypothetical protein